MPVPPKRPDDLPSLNSLEDRIERAQKTAHAGDSDAPVRPENTNASMRIATELFAGIAVGGFLGYYLDEWLGSSPFGLIICFFLGAGAGFRNILRIAQGAGIQDEK